MPSRASSWMISEPRRAATTPYRQALRVVPAGTIQVQHFPVLLVDEPQDVTSDRLKQIHHLYKFSTNVDILIQVALFG
jgi:hypothetical protein